MQFNLSTFLLEIVNFVVLAYVLHRLLYRPLRDAIDERRQANERARAEAEQAQADAVALQKKLQAQLIEMEGQRQMAIQEARELGETERRKLVAEGEKVVQRRQQELRQAMDREREEMLRSLREEVRSLRSETRRAIVARSGRRRALAAAGHKPRRDVEAAS